MDKQMTAVEWLIYQIESNHAIGYNQITTQQIQQAKEMERKQIEEAYNAGYRNAEKDLGQWIIAVDISTLSNASDYFTKTYSAPKEGSF